MKKLAISLAIVLATSLALSSAVSAAMINPSKTQKSTAASEKTTPKKDSSSTKSQAKKDETITLVRSSRDGKPDKKGTESISVTKLNETKKEKITMTLPDGYGSLTTFQMDVTIYEIPVGAKIITTSADTSGKASVNMIPYPYDANGKTYAVILDAPRLSVGARTMTTDDIGNLYSVSVQTAPNKGEPIGNTSCSLGLDDRALIRVVAAE